MKTSPFKVMTSAALASALAVPAVATTAPSVVDAAETEILDIAIEVDGEVKTVSYEDFTNALFDGSGEVYDLYTEGEITSVSVEEGQFVKYESLANAVFDAEEGTTTTEVLAELNTQQDAKVSEDVVAEYKGLGEEEAALAVDSVDAVKVDQLEVSFNNAVDTDDVTLDVNKGDRTVEGEVEWNEDNTVATITTTAKLTDGEYTVTATSADGSVDLSGSTEVEDQQVAEIEILNDTALTDSDSEKAYVYYDVLDQYGESIRSTTSIQWSSSGADEDVDRSTGVITIANDDATDPEPFNYSEKIYITGVHTESGTSVNKTVEVGAKQSLDTIDVAGYLKKGTNEIVESLPAGFNSETYYTVFQPLDQNGNPLMNTDEATLDDQVTFVSENVLLIKELNGDMQDFTINGEDYYGKLVEPGMNVDDGGEVTIEAIANNTGNKTTITTTIAPDVTLSSFKMLAPTGMIADGESVEIPFEALDQNGEEITDFETLAKNKDFNNLNFTSSEGTLTLKEQNDGSAKLVYSDDDFGWNESETTDGLDRTVSVTTTVVGGDTSQQSISISDKARPVAISSVDMQEVFVEGASEEVYLSQFEFLDQYGRNMTSNPETKPSTGADGNFVFDNGFFEADSSDLQGREFNGFDFYVNAEYKGESSDFTISGNEIDDTEDGDYLSLTADENVASSSQSGYSVEFEIAKKESGGESESVSTDESVGLTIADITALTNFNVSEFNKFYVNTNKSSDQTGQDLEGSIDSAVTTADILAGYSQDVVLTGSYNGETVTIPNEYYYGEAGKLKVTTGDTIDAVTDGAFKWSDFYDATTARYLRKDAEDTVTVTVEDIHATSPDTIAVVSENVTASDAEAEVTSINGVDELTFNPENTEFSAFTDVELSDGKFLAFGNLFEVKDQYGVDHDISKEDIKFEVSSVEENENGYAENNFRANNNNQQSLNVTGAERGDTFELTIKVGDVTKVVDVTVGADTNSYIDNDGNEYLDELIDNALEEDRKQGLE